MDQTFWSTWLEMTDGWGHVVRFQESFIFILRDLGLLPVLALVFSAVHCAGEFGLDEGLGLVGAWPETYD